MASGKPLSPSEKEERHRFDLHPEEKAFIEANMDEKFPTVIARHLVLYYSKYNGGYRKTSTVQTYIRTLKRAAEKKAQVKQIA